MLILLLAGLTADVSQKKTTKTWRLLCIKTRDRPTSRQSFHALITSTSQTISASTSKESDGVYRKVGSVCTVYFNWVGAVPIFCRTPTPGLQKVRSPNSDSESKIMLQLRVSREVDVRMSIPQIRVSVRVSIKC